MPAVYDLFIDGIYLSAVEFLSIKLELFRHNPILSSDFPTLDQANDFDYFLLFNNTTTDKILTRRYDYERTRRTAAFPNIRDHHEMG